MVSLTGIFLFLKIENVKCPGPDSQSESMFLRVKSIGIMHVHCSQQRKHSSPQTGAPDIPGEKTFLKTLI